MSYYVPVPQQHQAQGPRIAEFPMKKHYLWNSYTKSKSCQWAGSPKEGASGTIPTFAAVLWDQWPAGLSWIQVAAAGQAQWHRNADQPQGMDSLLGLQPGRAQGSRQTLCVDREPVQMKRCSHLEFMVVDMHIYCRCANNKFGCNATVENSQHEVREKSYWEVLPGFEKKNGVSKGGKQLEGKSKFRNRSLCLIR